MDLSGEVFQGFQPIFGDEVVKGDVPDDEASIKQIALMMHASNSGSSLGSLLVCCTGSPSNELQLRTAHVLDSGSGLYAKGQRLRKWCIEEHERLPFELTENNIRKCIELLIRYGILKKARIANRGEKVLEPISDAKPSSELAAFNKEFYLWRRNELWDKNDKDRFEQVFN
jgi:hypothetical protein